MDLHIVKCARREEWRTRCRNNVINARD